MKKVNRFIIICAAVVFALVIAGAQLAWNLRTPAYLEGVANRADTHTAVARALPEYASQKLPDPETTKELFANNVSTGSVDMALQSLYGSISDAYNGKTNVVELDLAPIVRPVQSAGYQIPPGTVFANEKVAVGGSAPLLQLAHRSLIPSVLILVLLLGLVTLLGSRNNPLRAIRSVLLVTALILGGLYVATLGIPPLVSSLIASSSLDDALRDILLGFINVLIADMGRYYIVCIAVLVLGSLALSIALGLMHRRKRPVRHKKAVKEPAAKDEF